MSARSHKTGFGQAPRKGTKLRKFLLHALRPAGISCQIANDLFGGRNRASSATDRLRDEKGYDLRTFRNGDIAGPHNYPLKSWRLVGKMRWDGSYRSFTHGIAKDAQ